MPFETVQPEKLSQGVVRQIELLILRGILRPGERLPPNGICPTGSESRGPDCARLWLSCKRQGY